MVRKYVETDSPMKPLLTVGEVAQLLHIHKNTVRRWSDEKIIPSFRICRRGDRRYKLDDIDNFIIILKGHTGNPRVAELRSNFVLDDTN